MMILLTDVEKIYIAASSILVLLLVVLILCFIYHYTWRKKHYKEVTYMKLSSLAKHNDYLLLNNYKIDFDDQHVGLIDHILISKKYIIVINDFPISGVISGELKSRSLRVINDKKEISEINNPLNYNINLIKRLNLYKNIDQSFVKGLVVVNDDAIINISNKSSQFFLIRRKDLSKTIKKFDNDNVKNLNEDSIVKFINILNKENKDV